MAQVTFKIRPMHSAGREFSSEVNLFGGKTADEQLEKIILVLEQNWGIRFIAKELPQVDDLSCGKMSYAYIESGIANAGKYLVVWPFTE